MASKGKDRLRIAALEPSRDVRDLLAQLLKDADRGDINGAIVILMHPRKHGNQLYTIHVAGLACTNPTLAAGVGASAGIILRERSLKDAGLK